MIYHVGNLLYDRSIRSEQGRAAAKVAREVWRKYLAGEVDLFQRRVLHDHSPESPGVIEYHAIPRRRPYIPVTWLGGRKYKVRCGSHS